MVVQVLLLPVFAWEEDNADETKTKTETPGQLKKETNTLTNCAMQPALPCLTLPTWPHIPLGGSVAV